MRVITGEARGRKLLEPSGRDIRPTTYKVKEAMFNIVQFAVPGARVLDLFAGTGQLGIEALSRGARECVFVDRSQEAQQLIKRNLEAVGFLPRACAIRTDSLTYLQSGGQFDLVFVDPPYGAGLLEKVLEQAWTYNTLKKDGIMICESDKSLTLSPPEGRCSVKREYLYGRVKLTTITREG